MYLTDTGLASHLLGADAEGLAVPEDRSRGPLLETFVVNELAKQLAWSGTRAQMHHFRDRNGPEIDIVLETPDGRVVAVEVKAAMTVTRKDFKQLAWMRDKLGDAFVHGYVLSLHDTPLSFGDRLTALPVSSLWRQG